MRSWPALYQMFPAWDAAGVDTGDEGNLMRADVWHGHDAIDPALLARARETREWLVNPLSHLAGVDVALLMTSDKETAIALDIEDGPVTSTVARTGSGDTLVPYDATLDWYGDELRSRVELVNEVSHVHAKLLNDSAIWERAKS